MPTADAMRLTLYLDADLHKALRLKSAHSRRSMSDLVDEALRQMLQEDEEDLAAVRSRAREKALGYEEFLGDLKAKGRL